jgi:hypothetical protein
MKFVKIGQRKVMASNGICSHWCDAMCVCVCAETLRRRERITREITQTITLVMNRILLHNMKLESSPYHHLLLNSRERERIDCCVWVLLGNQVNYHNLIACWLKIDSKRRRKFTRANKWYIYCFESTFLLGFCSSSLENSHRFDTSLKFRAGLWSWFAEI